MHRIGEIALSLLFFCGLNELWAQPIDLDKFPWIKPELNQIQFEDINVVRPFYDKWRSNKSLTIAHFGDSHIQPDYFTGRVRDLLQSHAQARGRGLIFPFSIARTYSPADYTSNYHGVWQAARSLEYRPKLALGISGITARTFDEHAGFAIRFKESVPEHYRKIRFFVKQRDDSFDMVVRCAGGQLEVPIGKSSSGQPYIEVDMPIIGDYIEVELVRKNDSESQFEFYGLSLESDSPSGLIYHNLGIGGAQFRSILTMAYFEEQLAAIEPDLVILDFGTNDHLYKNRVPEEMDSVIVEAIRRVRSVLPDALVLLTTTQDMNLRGLNISSGRLYSALIRKIAVEQKCAFYDWYWVSGGPGTMQLWVDHGLAQPDHIHLSPKGYQLKGDLFHQAFQSGLKLMGEGKEENILTADTLSYESILAAQDSLAILFLKRGGVESSSGKAGKVVLHRILPGESLSSIANKYHVSVSDLRAWNLISGSLIIAGRTLKVRVEDKSKRVNKPAKGKVLNRETLPQTKSGNNKRTIIHVIQSGETLSGIAGRYGISVDELRRMNNLKDNKIIAGKELTITIR